jgi:integrase
VLTDDELARVIIAAREIGGPYGGIVERLALTGQRPEEAARCIWDELVLPNRIWTLPNLRTKNAKPHIVHLSDQAIAVLSQVKRQGSLVFSITGAFPFQGFSGAKRELESSSAMACACTARLGTDRARSGQPDRRLRAGRPPPR